MSVNKWIGIGNLTRDPEIKHTNNGKTVSSFTIACNERYKDKDGQKQESVEFVNIVSFGNLAEICGRYLAKGKKIYIEGKINTSSYEKDGQKRYSTKIIMNEMVMLDSKDQGFQPNNSGGYNQNSFNQGLDYGGDDNSDFDDPEIPF